MPTLNYDSKAPTTIDISSIAEAGIMVNMNNVFKSNMVFPCVFCIDNKIKIDAKCLYLLLSCNKCYKGCAKVMINY